MDKLKLAIERYQRADTIRKAAGAKGVITRLTNELAQEIGPVEARKKIWEVLAQVEHPDWMRQRFSPGSFYKEGDRFFGWWDEGQLQFQAEELPFYKLRDSLEVCFAHCRDDSLKWQLRGFYVATQFPVFRGESHLEVSFPVEKTPFWIEFGYALPCSLQWRWDENGFYVTRSIISQGFWCAYKWWEGCQWWYYEKHPEWFADMAVWGEDVLPQQFEPENDPYAAVLGGDV
jgi:hypothetical protein